MRDYASGGKMQIIFISLFLAFAAYGQQFTDPRDGKKYRTVKIGDFLWMAENLNYNSGDGKCYDNSKSNCKKYGRLYDWYTAKAICPSGWHLPDETEWSNLIKALGGEKIAGKQLKATSGWSDGSNGAFTYGFAALMGGYGHLDGSFHNVDLNGYWWSAKGRNSSAYVQYINYNNDNVYQDDYEKNFLYSVRCVQDKEMEESMKAADVRLRISSSKTKAADEKLDSLNRIRFGIGGVWGINYTAPKAIFNEVTDSKFDMVNGMELKIGLLLNIPIYTADNRQWAFSPELYYTYRWFDADIEEGNSREDSIMHLSTIASISERIINVPLLFKYRFLNVSSQIPCTFLEGGVQFGFPLKTTMENDNGYSEAYTNRNKFDFDLLMGMGLGGAVGSGEMYTNLRLGYSLLDFNKAYDSSIGLFAEVMMMWFF
jgi:uncharacterized protein (TIGR02145 family)